MHIFLCTALYVMFRFLLILCRMCVAGRIYYSRFVGGVGISSRESVFRLVRTLLDNSLVRQISLMGNARTGKSALISFERYLDFIFGTRALCPPFVIFISRTLKETIVKHNRSLKPYPGAVGFQTQFVTRFESWFVCRCRGGMAQTSVVPTFFW